MRLNRLLPKLFFRSLRYRSLRKTGRSARPQAVSLELTRRCVAHCVMCNIWKTPRITPELSISRWMELLSPAGFSDLREIDLTGGEPFLRDDLVDLMRNICESKSRDFPKLSSVAVTSNGFLTERVLGAVREMAGFASEADMQIVLAFAMDAAGELHDRIRGFPGGWERLHRTIQGAMEIRDAHQNMIIGLKTTIVPMNVDHLDAIVEYADRNDLFTIISPWIVTANRYDNVDLREGLEFTEAERAKLIEFYQSQGFKWSFHREMMLDYFSTGVVKKPCSAGFNYFFIRSSGDVYPCPIIPARLGNVKLDSFQRLIESAEARHFRRQVGRFPECASCTEPGLERYALPFEGIHYLKTLFRYGRNDFLKLYEHMGLDKYF